MTRQPPFDAHVSDAAALWAIRLSEGSLSPPLAAEFEAWKAADPRHPAALDTALFTWAELGEVHLPAPEPVQAPKVTAPVVAIRPTRRRGRIRQWAAAAAIILAVSVGVLTGTDVLLPYTADYASSKGEIRSIRLPDGSEVQLDAQSAFDVAFDDQERRIHLLKGTAIFSVAPMVGNEHRPFVVDYQGARSRALGTRFAVGDIDGDRSSAWMGVLEHSVALNMVRPPVQGDAQAVVKEGQSVRYDAAHGVRPLTQDVDRVTAWRNGQVVFERLPLAQVVERLRRYWPGQILLLNDELGQRQVSGLFRLGHLDDALAGVSQELGVRHVRLPGLTVLY